MRFLALLAVFLTVPLFGQKVVVNDDIAALAAKGVVSVAVVSDDPALGSLVQFALSAHGAIQVSPTSSVKLRIGRTANTAVVACDNAAYAFTTNVEARDEDQLALKVADAAIVGLGRRWQLKPLYADTKVTFVSRFTGHAEIYVTNLARSKTMRLTNYRNTSYGPRWSADGKRVFFISSFRSNFPEIFSTNGLGEAAKVITNVRGALGAASSGPDGRIAFASSNQETMDIFVAGPQGQSRHQGSEQAVGEHRSGLVARRRAFRPHRRPDGTPRHLSRECFRRRPAARRHRFQLQHRAALEPGLP
jgi:TolB protein